MTAMGPSSGDGSRSRPLPLRSVDEVVASRRVQTRDCRSCRNYEPSEDGLAYGWCRAHKQYVKLYHPPAGWYSQCLFKSLRRARSDELER